MLPLHQPRSFCSGLVDSLQTEPHPSHQHAVFLLRSAELRTPSKLPHFLLLLRLRRHSPYSAAKGEGWPWEHCSEPLLFPGPHRDTRRNL